MQPNRLRQLIKRLVDHRLTVLEKQELNSILLTAEPDEITMQVLELIPDSPVKEFDAALLPIATKAMAVDKRSVSEVHRVHFLRRGFLRYAAAVLLLIVGISVYLYYTTGNKTEVAQSTPPPNVQDVLPGTDKAILTLGDGQQIQLNSTANALLADKGISNKNAQITYSGQGLANVLNTLATPRGGQYKLRLPDGTMVWLNAASSITYPTIFTGQNRTISVTGEAYFEVARNREKPFVVTINADTKIEVLGTHFNINAYADESMIRTTLLEGSVKVTQLNKPIILTPGQQLNGTQLNKHADLGQVMAWKNGEFQFTGKRLDETMRQIARWYDVAVEYEKGIPDIQLGGKIGMDLPLSGVIKGLGILGVHCRLEPGKRLVVLSNN